MKVDPIATEVVFRQSEELRNSKSGEQENSGRESYILEFMIGEPLNDSALVFLRQIIDTPNSFRLLWDGGHSGNKLARKSPTERTADCVQIAIDCFGVQLPGLKDLNQIVEGGGANILDICLPAKDLQRGVKSSEAMLRVLRSLVDRLRSVIEIAKGEDLLFGANVENINSGTPSIRRAVGIDGGPDGRQSSEAGNLNCDREYWWSDIGLGPQGRFNPLSLIIVSSSPTNCLRDPLRHLPEFDNPDACHGSAFIFFGINC